MSVSTPTVAPTAPEYLRERDVPAALKQAVGDKEKIEVLKKFLWTLGFVDIVKTLNEAG